MTKKIGQVVLMDDGKVYVLASLIVENISIAPMHRLGLVSFLDEGERTPPYIEIDPAIAYLEGERGGRDGPLNIAINWLKKAKKWVIEEKP